MARLNFPLSDIQPLVHEIWGIVDIYVFDIRNHDYQFESAHHVQNIPVLIMKDSRERIYIWEATILEQNKVNVGVARKHNLSGFVEQPPLTSDHTKGIPQYPNPRNVSLLTHGYK